MAVFVPGRNFARAVSALYLGLGKQVLLFPSAPNLWLPLTKKISLLLQVYEPLHHVKHKTVCENSIPCFKQRICT